MQAADETVSSLLSLGASPDIICTANGNKNALLAAIQSKCVITINLLAPVTQENLGVALSWLAKEKVELTSKELRQMVERAAQDRETATVGLVGAARFGSSAMILMLSKHTKDHSIFEAQKQSIWMRAVKSDNAETISALLSLFPNPPLEAITLARERGVPGTLRRK